MTESATQPSGQPSTWWRILRTPAFVLGALLLIEMGIRLTEERLSLDIRHIRRMEGIVAELDASTSPRVLFIGNSLTRHGADLDLMKEVLAANGVEELSVAAIHPDDTMVLDWLYLYDRYVIEQDAVPDVVVIGFAAWQLDDRPVTRAQSYRLGRYFVSDRMLGDLVGNELSSLTERMNVLLARYSAAFAARERISRRVLSLLPSYEDSAQRVNDMLRDANEDERARMTFERLARLVAVVEGSGAELVLVAMPIRSGYDLDPEIVRTVEAGGAHLIDLRRIPGLTADMFLDGLHLLPEGAELYSRHTASALAPLLSRSAAVR